MPAGDAMPLLPITPRSIAAAEYLLGAPGDALCRLWFLRRDHAICHALSRFASSSRQVVSRIRRRSGDSARGFILLMRGRHGEPFLMSISPA